MCYRIFKTDVHSIDEVVIRKRKVLFIRNRLDSIRLKVVSFNYPEQIFAHSTVQQTPTPRLVRIGSVADALICQHNCGSNSLVAMKSRMYSNLPKVRRNAYGPGRLKDVVCVE